MISNDRLTMIQPLFTKIEKSNNNDIIVDDDPGIFHVFEMRIRLNEFDHRILALLKQLWERPERHLNPDFCKAGAVLYQWSYQANWEQVVMWVDYKPIHVDVEIDDEDTRIFPVFEMQIRMNEFDDGTLALLIK